MGYIWVFSFCLPSSDWPPTGRCLYIFLASTFPVLQMGRQATADEPFARAETKGYKREAHAESDQDSNREKHVKKTKKDQERTLRRYVLYVNRSLRAPLV